MRVLVTGGAGYIGSHTCIELLRAGHDVLVIDNLTNGHILAIERIKDITNYDLDFINADIRDADILDQIFSSFNPDSVIHFAGLKAVGESVVKPLDYYNVNVNGSLNLLAAMTRINCNNIIFSSSATVYGDPHYLPLDEKHPTTPVNPYGRTKLMVEEIIKDWVLCNPNRKGTALRYFNPTGAHQSGRIGEDPNGLPNNLMPFIAQVAIGRQDCLKVFGNEYQTKDGTGSRDYIHVMDLANAHLMAVQNQLKLNPFNIINIGCGESITVLELIEIFENVTGKSINYEFAPSRSGDISSSWADASQAFHLIGWKPKYTIKQMCEDTWRWQVNNPNGYKRKDT
jgi:UDP-glucose 4-epimerase